MGRGSCGARLIRSYAARLSVGLTWWIVAVADARAVLPVLEALEPSFAAPGDSVRLLGDAFDPFLQYSVTVAGAPASVLEVQPGFLRFEVPSAAQTGPVVLREGIDGEPVTHARSLTVLREIGARFAASLPIDTSSYGVGTIYGDDEGPGPAFRVRVARGEPDLVIGGVTAADPVLLAVASEDVSEVELGAESTALGLVFMLPDIFDADPAEAARRLAVLAALPETAALEQLIHDELEAGRDYVASPRLGDRVAAAGSALLEQLESIASSRTLAAASGEPAAGSVRDDFVSQVLGFATGQPRDLRELVNRRLLNRLDVKRIAGTKNDAKGVPMLRFKYDVAPLAQIGPLKITNNPLDWSASVYELDPSAFPGGKSDVDALTADYVSAYPRARARPISRIIVGSSSSLDKLDIFKLIKDSISKVFIPDPELRVPADRAALYIVRKHGGAYFPDQDPLIANLPSGRREALRMTTLNIVLASFDALSVFLKLSDILKDREILSIAISITSAVDKGLAKQVIGGSVDPQLMKTILTESLKATFEALFDKVKDGVSKGLLNARFLPMVGKVAVALVDVPGKIAAGVNFANRTLALTNFPHLPNVNMVQAVESSTVVVGNPWRPEITSFSPTSGHRGVVVKLRGRNFSAVPAQNIVEFNPPLSTDPNRIETARATVLTAGPSELSVQVPETARSGSGEITVRVPGMGRSSTSRLAPPYQKFRVLPDPILTSVEPATPVAGSILKLVGQNFSQHLLRNQVIIRTQGFDNQLKPITVTPTLITVRWPGINLASTIRVRITDDVNNVFRDTAQLPVTPEPAQGQPGSLIAANSFLDNTLADDFVTLREAMGWASGTLLRLPTEREASFINPNSLDPDLFGDGLADRITTSNVPGGTIVLTSPLPPLTSFDTLGLPPVLDARGVPGPVLRAVGASFIDIHVTFLTGTLKGGGGHGLHLTDVSFSRVSDLHIEDCGGDGIRLDGTSSFNLLKDVTVVRCAGDGVRMTGAEVAFNQCLAELDAFFDPNGLSITVLTHVRDNGGYGLRAEAGASFNVLACGDVGGNGLGGVAILDGTSVHNAVGLPDGRLPFGVRPPSRVALHIDGNLGHGVHTQAGNTRIGFLRVTANLGDGIRLEGASSTQNRVAHVDVGYDEDGTLAGNTGHGIHLRQNVSESVIGEFFNPDPAVSLSHVGGNLGHGIWLEGGGVHDIVIDGTHVGITQGGIGGPRDPPRAAPNGMSGIAITDGSHGNEIGTLGRGVVVVNHTVQPGILISGPTTQGNVVAATHVGTVPLSGNRVLAMPNGIGIHIADQAFANVIGLRGRSSGNIFRTNDVAAVLIESGTDPLKSFPKGATRTGGNVVQNNTFGDFQGGNEVGVLLRGSAVANRIGGTGFDEENFFSGNRRAGIEIDGVVATSPAAGNRIIGNVIVDHFDPDAAAVDPLLQTPRGVGVLVGGGSADQVIGGPGPGEANLILRNQVGCYVEGSQGIEIVGNEIGSAPFFFFDPNFFPGFSRTDEGNELGGVILKECIDCTVGPGNQLLANGHGPAAETFGAVTVHRGSGNRVVGNTIGVLADESQHVGNAPFGVLLDDSPRNQVGDFGVDGQNVIVDSSGPGVVVRGPLSLGNQIAANLIGETRGGDAIPNQASGVLIEGGASGNTVGGELRVSVGGSRLPPTPAGNLIRANGQDGVRVQGAGTLGNTITHNSIFGHVGLGIENRLGGNRELPPPTLTEFVNGRVRGTVDSSAVPDGSRVQVFNDEASEGEVPVGTGSVFRGAFALRVAPLALPELTATVTHAGTGDTSEFGNRLQYPAGVDVRKALEVRLPSVTVAPRSDVPVLPLQIRALNLAATITRMGFEASGDLNDASDIIGVSLYRDEDADGQISAADTQLAGPGTFDADDGSVSLQLEGAALSTIGAESWLLVYDLASGIPAGRQFTASLTSAMAVEARASLGTGSPLPVSGMFPAVSDTIQVRAGLSDIDGDGWPDAEDDCPVTADPDQLDSDGDGIGDACQCGDIDRDGLLRPSDSAAFRAHLADPVATPLSPEAQSKCTVIGVDRPCDLLDVVVIRRALALPPRPPAPAQVCRAATGA
ncbi:MAG: IPT/TIG domain-containing protein [Myxococcota bacterium]